MIAGATPTREDLAYRIAELERIKTKLETGLAEVQARLEKVEDRNWELEQNLNRIEREKAQWEPLRTTSS